MQTFNSFNELAGANGAPVGDVTVFNDRTRMNQIHARIKSTQSANIKTDPELAKLVQAETQYWQQVDKTNLSAEQRRDLNDWKAMYEYIRKASGNKPTIDDVFQS